MTAPAPIGAEDAALIARLESPRALPSSPPTEQPIERMPQEGMPMPDYLATQDGHRGTDGPMPASPNTDGPMNADALAITELYDRITDGRTNTWGLVYEGIREAYLAGKRAAAPTADTVRAQPVAWQVASLVSAIEHMRTNVAARAAVLLSVMEQKAVLAAIDAAPPAPQGAERDEAMEVLRELWGYIERGELVRDTSEDARAEWAPKMMKFMLVLQRARALLAKERQ